MLRLTQAPCESMARRGDSQCRVKICLIPQRLRTHLQDHDLLGHSWFPEEAVCNNGKCHCEQRPIYWEKFVIGTPYSPDWNIQRARRSCDVSCPWGRLG